MLIKLERDRLKTRAQIQREIAQNAPADVIPVEPEPAAKTTQKSKLTPFPSAVRENPRGEVRV